MASIVCMRRVTKIACKLGYVHTVVVYSLIQRAQTGHQCVLCRATEPTLFGTHVATLYAAAHGSRAKSEQELREWLDDQKRAIRKSISIFPFGPLRHDSELIPEEEQKRLQSESRERWRRETFTQYRTRLLQARADVSKLPVMPRRLIPGGIVDCDCVACCICRGVVRSFEDPRCPLPVTEPGCKCETCLQLSEMRRLGSQEHPIVVADAARAGAATTADIPAAPAAAAPTPAAAPTAATVAPSASRAATVASADIAMARAEYIAGRECRAHGDFDFALMHYEEALHIFRSKLGPLNHRIGVTLSEICVVLCRQGKLREAMGMYDEARPIIEASWNRVHHEVAIMLHNFAALHVRTKDYHRAKTLFNEVLRIETLLYGADSTSTRTTQEWLRHIETLEARSAPAAPAATAAAATPAAAAVTAVPAVVAPPPAAMNIDADVRLQINRDTCLQSYREMLSRPLPSSCPYSMPYLRRLPDPVERCDCIACLEIAAVGISFQNKRRPLPDRDPSCECLACRELRVIAEKEASENTQFPSERLDDAHGLHCELVTDEDGYRSRVLRAVEPPAAAAATAAPTRPPPPPQASDSDHSSEVQITWVRRTRGARPRPSPPADADTATAAPPPPPEYVPATVAPPPPSVPLPAADMDVEVLSDSSATSPPSPATSGSRKVIRVRSRVGRSVRKRENHCLDSKDSGRSCQRRRRNAVSADAAAAAASVDPVPVLEHTDESPAAPPASADTVAVAGSVSTGFPSDMITTLVPATAQVVQSFAPRVYEFITALKTVIGMFCESNYLHGLCIPCGPIPNIWTYMMDCQTQEFAKIVIEAFLRAPTCPIAGTRVVGAVFSHTDGSDGSDALARAMHAASTDPNPRHLYLTFRWSPSTRKFTRWVCLHPPRDVTLLAFSDSRWPVLRSFVVVTSASRWMIALYTPSSNSRVPARHDAFSLHSFSS